MNRPKKASPDSFVTTVDLSLREKLEQDLKEQGFTLTPAPYAFFSAKKPGLSCTFYSSGKLVVQGKNKGEFLTFYLEPEILQNLSFSHPATLHDASARIGMDEAGKGDFFGPLCIAALFAKENSIDQLLRMGVKDSKRLSDEQVLTISQDLKTSFPHKILTLFPKTYNRLYDKYHNLNLLLAWGHATALEELSVRTGCTQALLDQFAFPSLMESILKRKKLQIHLTQRVRGEEDPVVAAASILARAAFVEGLQQLEEETGLTLPKGASSLVTQAAKKAVAQKGAEILPLIAKYHFKTTQSVLHA
ncbi:MAG: ribonuclease HIII [Chlamydiae bacterium]|nr:ribonuclease HIII [Chlamydiota bacterium]